ncbi:major facilitator superfamily domain-containing protein [Cyathus striatus]|nr:major facilitator superfamily domain-containing protein [Cyathus striatus]
MSVSITSDRANLRKRGTTLAYIFSNQGWGSFVGSLATIIVLEDGANTSKVDGSMSDYGGSWRIVVGISLIPAFGTLCQRLTLQESTHFIASKRQTHSEDGHELDEINELKRKQREEEEKTKSSSPNVDILKVDGEASLGGYFSKWKYLKLLLGTCVCWFLLDIACYGTNLDQNIVLQQIGYDGSDGTPWNCLFNISTGRIIITALGFVPGYYATALLIEKLGRKWIQIQGFLCAALLLGILAGKFTLLSKPAFIVCFALLQFFFNFGANTTTYCYPAEGTSYPPYLLDQFASLRGIDGKTRGSGLE